MSLWGLAGPATSGPDDPAGVPSEQGRLQGANAALTGIAGLLGPALVRGGVLHDHCGPVSAGRGLRPGGRRSSGPPAVVYLSCGLRGGASRRPAFG